MRPLYFGPGGELFGCYHPGGLGGSATAVVLCPALFGEHVQQYRLLNRLATGLDAAGVPVLRFDWYGTGDSAGDLDGTTVDRWQADLRAACDWVCRQAGCDRLVLAGWRVGATLASGHAVHDDRVTALVLWDPVVSGREYLRELRAAHVANLGGYADIAETGDPDDELLGFVVPEGLRAGIGALRLAAPACPVFVTGADLARVRAAATVLTGSGGPVRAETMAVPDGWMAPDDGIYDILVPVEPLRATVEWIVGSTTATAA